jgi:hypothetical protein
MENYTDLNDQQSYLESADLGQSNHLPFVDFPSLPNPDTLQDFNSVPNGTHQTFFDATCKIASGLKTAGESSMLNVLQLQEVSPSLNNLPVNKMQHTVRENI